MRKKSTTMLELTKDQIDFHLGAIDHYINAVNAATGAKVDSNANIEQKTIASLSGEQFKSETIQINRSLVQESLVDVFGPGPGRRLAKQYLRDLEDHVIYCHDETSLNLYCCAINLFPMLEHGTRVLGGKSAAPKHLQSYVGQLLNTVFIISSQVAGAVGAPGALVHFDAYARSDFGDNYLETNLKDIKASLETFLYTINEPAGSRNAQSCFSNISILDKAYFDALYGNMYYPAIPEIKPSWDSYKKLQEYALDFIREENTKQVLTFPVKTATVLHDGEKPKDPEFVDMIADDLSKGSLMFIYLSDSVDSLSSCCRLRSSIIEEGDNEFSYSLGAGGVSTGSLNVITLNINRIVQENKNLKSIIDRVHKYQIAHRYIVQRFKDAGLLPLYDAGFVDMDKQFLTIGINGLVEAAESKGMVIEPGGEYQDFANKILETISSSNKEARKLYGCKFNTEFVPAEALGVRNAKWDREDGLRVPRDCYNSYMFPVEDPKISIVDKFKLHGKDLGRHCDGGQALHLNLDEHPTKEGYKALISLAIKTGCEYFTTNVLRTCCEDCGRVEFSKKDLCMSCGSDNVSYATRIIGYLKKIPNFSDKRQEEASIRIYSPLELPNDLYETTTTTTTTTTR